MTDEELANTQGFNDVSEMIACCAGDHDKTWLDVEGGQWITFNITPRNWHWLEDAHEPYEGR